MPFKDDPSCLGESKAKAEKCLKALQNRIIRDKEFFSLYNSFMQEYLTMGHMEEVKEEKLPDINYFIPHHGIFRKDSKSTPLRVVFNASSLTTSGKSLNCLQYIGGVIQDDLYSIVLRFRKHQFVLIADIKKMYRMIEIHPSQRDLLRILWSPQVGENPKTYRLCTVTYGTSSAPFLATRTLQQLAKDDGAEFPLAASTLVSDVYMDDVLTGADSLVRAKELQVQLVSLLAKGCMQLHKWAANHESLLCDNPESGEYCFNNDTRTLGLLWKPRDDCFIFDFTIDEKTIYTKRSVLSQIAKIFDPLGLIGPIITTAKVFMQKLWLLKIDWSHPLPLNENLEWHGFLQSLKNVHLIKIPRFCLVEHGIQIELHGFSDASEIAYGAVIYVKSTNQSGESTTKLLTSKSRVSPLKRVTIPRLELCAAVLLTKLMRKVMSALKLEITNVYFWTDSTIVLSWLRKETSDLKTFVANRISIIQNLTSIDQWHHVNTKMNPADLISRGMDSSKLYQCELWWFGPSFLCDAEFSKSDEIPVADQDELFLQEIKPSSVNSVCALVNNSEPLDIINNCSSFTKVQRVVAWCRRFLHNTRNPLYRLTGCLSSSELYDSLLCIVKNIQKTSFSKEIHCLTKGIALSRTSNILKLFPFLDSNGVLRVGGRLSNSNFSFEKKYPIILPTKHNFTNAIINHVHLVYFHTGAECTLALLRRQFWIVAARRIVRKIIFNCIRCRRVSSKACTQRMADLPEARVTIGRVFSKIGLDFCGPFKLKLFVGRSKQVRKIYVCIFVCFATKAAHLEIVHDLTTSAFLAALKRFIARRGKPSEIFSDNGRNFVGANNEIKNFLKLVFKGKDREDIDNYLANEGIKWHFNPPSAPHFGGLWEACVKSFKYHLKRVIGTNILSYEEFLTLVTQIEAVLNSRPLCPLSSDPNDVEALTPAHFIIGSPLVALPEPNYSEIPVNRLSRWQLLQKLTQQIWKQWSCNYLNQLMQRPKWYVGNEEIKEGDLILIKNSDDQKFLKWNLARVIKTHPGKDNIVRVVTIRDNNGIYKKPTT